MESPYGEGRQISNNKRDEFMNPVKYQFWIFRSMFAYCMLLISFIPLAAIARSKDTTRIGVLLVSVRS